jgi:recombination protein RecA
MKDTLAYKFKELNKKYGRDNDNPLNKKPKLKPKVNTGIMTLDWVMNGGYERNSIITMYGKEGSLKTTIGLKLLAEAQRRGEDCVLIDVEHGCTVEYMKTLGVDTESLIVVDDLPHGEAYLDVVYEIINEADFIMIDSTTALTPKTEMEKSLQEGKERALQAKLFTAAFKKFALKNQNTTILLISQLRESVKTTPNGAVSTYLPGGRSLHYYSDYKLNIKRKDRLDENGKKVDAEIGNVSRRTDVTKVNLVIVCEKNRKGKSFRVGEISFDHVTGCTNELEELIKIGIRTKVIGLGGSWYNIEYKGKEYKAQGAPAFSEYIKQDPEFGKWLKARIIEATK